MPRPLLVLLSVLIAGGAVVRGVSLPRPNRTPAGEAVRLATLVEAAAAERPLALGLLKSPAGQAALRRVTNVAAEHPLPLVSAAVAVERYVPDAPIVLATGRDGAFGRRGLDDDFDGVVDNRSELGSFRSDDLALAPSLPGYRQAVASADSRVVGQGGFAPVEPAAETEPPEPGQRYRLLFRFAGPQTTVVWPVEVEP